MSKQQYVHFLQARSGFGDRIVDAWAAITIAKLLNPTAQLSILWDPKGINFKDYYRSKYSTSLFSISNCMFTSSMDQTLHMPSSMHFNSDIKQEICIQTVSSSIDQIILRDGYEWGNSTPERIYESMDYYGLDKTITLEQIIECYREVAQSTEPAPEINTFIPTDINNRIGIHVRRNDKLVETEKNHSMTQQTWLTVQQRAKQQIEHCIRNDKALFICSDDLEYKRELVEEINRNGGDVKTIDSTLLLDQPAGYAALCDFFALSRCRQTIQMSKYSTFSIAAAIVGQVPLMNFLPEGGIKQNRIYHWQRTLRRLEFGSQPESY